jgi:erythromycin esterase-like protein
VIVEQVAEFLAGRAARVVALGEPMHGPEAFPELRNAILGALPECGAVAIESESLAGAAVAEFVLGGPGELDEVVAAGLSPAFRGIAANRSLVAGLRASPGRFAAIDVPMGFHGGESPRRALRLLHDLLGSTDAVVPGWERIDALIGDDGLWAGSIDVPPEVQGTAAEMVWALRTRLPQLDPHAARVGELAARTVEGLLAFHTAATGLSHHERLLTGLGIRDRLMAENVFSLERTTRQVLLFAHNQHVRRGRAHVEWDGLNLRWVSAGAHLDQSFGAGYVTFATAIGEAPDRGVGVPPPNTLEGMLATDPTPRLVPTAEIDASGLVEREPTPGYLPLQPGSLADFDAVLFLPSV